MSTRIIFTCGREPEYPRNAVILKVLRENFDVIEITDHTSWMPLRYIILFIKLFISTRKQHDLIFIGFHGHILIFFARLFSSKPIILDAFSSIYDTFCFDRKVFSPESIFGKLSFWIDQNSCNLASVVCLDTNSHAQYYHNTFNIPEVKIRVFPVGCDEFFFYPRKDTIEEPIVLYFGNFLPLQGMDVIIKAAKKLDGKSLLKFIFIGNGIDFSRIVLMAQKWGIQNVEFLPPVPVTKMPEYIARSMICLGGHFGTSDKANRVIAGKTYISIAMGKPTIVGDNEANRELLTHKYDAWFTPLGDPDALADAIIKLENDVQLRESIGENGYKTFLKRGTTRFISHQILNIINQLEKGI